MNLHDAIMNLRADLGDRYAVPGEHDAFLAGHKQARHGAAELAAAEALPDREEGTVVRVLTREEHEEEQHRLKCWEERLQLPNPGPRWVSLPFADAKVGELFKSQNELFLKVRRSFGVRVHEEDLDEKEVFPHSFGRHAPVSVYRHYYP